MKIQAEAYAAELIEHEDLFLYKLELYPKGCIGAFHQNALCGYIFCQPHIEGEIIPLDSGKHEIPSNLIGTLQQSGIVVHCTCYYFIIISHIESSTSIIISY